MNVKPPTLTGGGSGAPGEPDDGRLAELAAQGDRDAAGMLIERYQSPVRAFLFRLTGGKADVADDLAQETFIKMLRYAHRFDPQYAMMTWLMTIARRLWLNHLRQIQGKSTSGETEHMVGQHPDPADIAEVRDRRHHARIALDDALQQLSEPQRSAVLLYHQQGMSISEVSEIMKMPEGTIKSHLHRARAAMRRILEPQSELIDP